jgi:hypothetical protein
LLQKFLRRSRSGAFSNGSAAEEIALTGCAREGTMNVGPGERGMAMIDVLDDMPEGVAGIRVSGRVSGADLRAFEPTMSGLLAADEIRFVELVADDYEGFGPGGLVEDLKVGFGAMFRHHSKFKRIAVVSDREWVAHALHALAWMVPGELAIFGIAELDRAKEWAAG